MRTSAFRAPHPLRHRPLLAGALLLLLFLLASSLPLHAARKCYPIEDAVAHLNRSACIHAHVYDEIDLDDGTRILDVCGPEHGGEACRFALVSLSSDRPAVGDLHPLIGTDVDIHGAIQPVRGRAEILVRSAQQFRPITGKRAEKRAAGDFHPNPELLKGFNAAQNKAPVVDATFRPHGGHSSAY